MLIPARSVVSFNLDLLVVLAPVQPSILRFNHGGVVVDSDHHTSYRIRSRLSSLASRFPGSRYAAKADALSGDPKASRATTSLAFEID
jgi:hypothetical protein